MSSSLDFKEIDKFKDDLDKCTKCGTCKNVCPERFGAVVKVSGEKPDVPSEPIPVTAPRPNAKKADSTEETEGGNSEG